MKKNERKKDCFVFRVQRSGWFVSFYAAATAPVKSIELSEQLNKAKLRKCFFSLLFFKVSWQHNKCMLLEQFENFLFLILSASPSMSLLWLQFWMLFSNKFSIAFYVRRKIFVSCILVLFIRRCCTLYVDTNWFFFLFVYFYYVTRTLLYSSSRAFVINSFPRL